LNRFNFSLAGLDPAIHVFLLAPGNEDVDPRVKPGIRYLTAHIQ
jgi:hypothetical protein